MKPVYVFAFIAAMLAASLTSCNLPNNGEAGTPTVNVTQAYQTVEARLTEVVAQTPTLTPTASATPTPAQSSTPTSTAQSQTPTQTLPAVTTAAPASCDKVSPGYPKIDATIDDDTPMLPGQVFTKVWRLVNSGTCTWTKDYAVVFVYGDAMGAATVVPLKGNVAPGQTVEVAVDMTAPATAGTYQGNWKLRNAQQAQFGIGPNGSFAFWVRIIVVASGTASPTPTPTGTLIATLAATATPTQQPTPPARASGPAILMPGSTLDLDTNTINGGDADLSYNSTPEGAHLLAPQNGALLGIYGTNQPGMTNCQGAALAGAAVNVDNLPVGTYLCYRTSHGFIGRALVTGFNVDDFAVSLNIFTWSQP